MRVVRFRVVGDYEIANAMIVRLHEMDKVDRVEEVADQMHSRDDVSSLGLPDDEGPDFHSIEAAQALLARMLPARHGAVEAPKVDVPDMEALMLDIISGAVRRYGKPVAKMDKEEKTAAVEMMLERGLFMVRGGVERAATALGVTRFTVYNYLEDVKSRRGAARTAESRQRSM